MTAVHEGRVGDETIGGKLRKRDRCRSEHERGDRVQSGGAQQLPPDIGPGAFRNGSITTCRGCGGSMVTSASPIARAELAYASPTSTTVAAPSAISRSRSRSQSRSGSVTVSKSRSRWRVREGPSRTSRLRTSRTRVMPSSVFISPVSQGPKSPAQVRRSLSARPCRGAACSVGPDFTPS